MLQHLLPLLFFVSGATGLVYEVIWSRALQQLFGVSTFAITVVVAAYMAGLALGSARFGRVADRVTPARAAILYGVLELAIGLFALAFPWLLDGVAAIWRGIGQGLVHTPSLRAAAEFTLTFTLLLIPTTCMGATLPLVTRALLRDGGQAGAVFGGAYALNTAGAVTGVLLATFVLLGELGMQGSALLVAAINLALGALAILAARRSPVQAPPAAAATPATAPAAASPAAATPAPPRDVRLLWLAGAIGFLALASEIVWVRGFATLYLSTTYTFALVLAVFLVGIALGAACGAHWSTRSARLPWVVLGLAAATLTQVALYGPLHTWTLATIAGGSLEHWGLLLLAVAGASVVVLPLAVASGAVLPLIVAALQQRAGPARAGRDVGAAYVANTIGSVLGCVLAGFVLLPYLGPFTTSRVLAVAAVGVAVVVLRPERRVLAGAAVVLLGAWALPGPSLSQQTISPLVVAVRAPGAYDRAAIARGETWEQRLPAIPLARAHGRACDMALVLDLWSGDRGLWLNGMPNATTYGDQQTQLQCAALPYLFAAGVKDALHIGLGIGISTGAWASLPGTERTTVIEIEQGLWDFTRAYAPFTYGLHENPNVRFVADDARAQLEVWPDASLDVIASEPSQLWTKCVGNLFTSEFFRCAKKKLRPDGVLMTWIMGSGIPGDVFAVGVQTLLDEFPHVLAFMGPACYGDVIFVAGQKPLHVSAERFESLLHASEPGAGVARTLRWRTPADLGGYLLGDDAAVREAAAHCLARGGRAAVRNTDDRPVLEHLYPRYVLGGQVNDFIELLKKRRLRADHTYVLPPGVAGPLPLDRRFELALHDNANALAAVTGLTRFTALTPAATAALGAEQRGWAFAAAVFQGDDPQAQKLWPLVAGTPITESYVAQAALRYLDAHQDAAGVDALWQRTPGPGPWLHKETVAAFLDHDEQRFRKQGQTASASRFVTTFLGAIPVSRTTELSLPTSYFAALAEAGLACGRADEVEAYLRDCRAHARAMHFGYDVGLWTLRRARGDLAGADGIRAAYGQNPAAAIRFETPALAAPMPR